MKNLTELMEKIDYKIMLFGREFKSLAFNTILAKSNWAIYLSLSKELMRMGISILSKHWKKELLRSWLAMKIIPQ